MSNVLYELYNSIDPLKKKTSIDTLQKNYIICTYNNFYKY